MPDHSPFSSDLICILMSYYYLMVLVLCAGPTILPHSYTIVPYTGPTTASWSYYWILAGPTTIQLLYAGPSSASWPYHYVQALLHYATYTGLISASWTYYSIYCIQSWPLCLMRIYIYILYTTLSPYYWMNDWGMKILWQYVHPMTTFELF